MTAHRNRMVALVILVAFFAAVVLLMVAGEPAGGIR